MVVQVVVPQPYHHDILSAAHDGPFSAHLGVRKMYDHVLKHFYWSGLKAEVVAYCKSCHTCQIPNQVIPHAPLRPIPAIVEQFEHVNVDCAGPLHTHNF